MGAFGWSDGPGPGSVVCAKAPTDKALEKPRTNTAKFPISLFFISSLFYPTTPKPFPDLRIASAVPKAEIGRTVTILFSMWKRRGDKSSAHGNCRIGQPQPVVVVFGHSSRFREIGDP